MPLIPLSFDDFSGGLADRYVGKDVTRASLIENFLVDETRKPIVRDGTFVHTTVFPIAPGSTRPTGLYVGPEPYAHPLVVMGPHAYTVAENGNAVEILGPAFNTFLPTKTDQVFEAALIWRRQLIAAPGMTGVLPQMIFCTSYSTPSSTATPAQYTAITLGLPSFTAAPTTAASGVNSYGYAIFYKYTFTDYSGVQFTFFGNPLLFSVTNSNDPGTTPINFTGVQSLVNTSLTNYDVSNVKIEIYRTINGGSQYLFNQEISNGTTTFTDNVPDSTLQLNQPIYTASGALGYDQPPTGAIAVTQANDYFWFATPSTLYQSIPGNPGGCPTSFNQPMDQKIVGLSSILSFPILFCDKSVFRVEGVFDEFGNGGFIPREISQVAGCVSNESIVRIPGGLVWAGNGGFYYTDGYQVMKISRHLDLSYTRWSSGQISGEYDSGKNIVVWTCRRFTSRGNTLAPNDLFVVLQLNFPITMESSFTTMASYNYSLGPNLYPTTVAFSTSLDLINAGAPYNQWYGKMMFADARGYLLWFDRNALTDPLINPLVSPSAFTTAAVLYSWASAGLEHGSLGRRKWTPQVAVEIDSDYPCAMQIRHRRDDGGAWSGTGGSPAIGVKFSGSPGGGSAGSAGSPEVRQDGPITWNITDCLWLNDPTEHYWNSNPTIEAKRAVPSGITADMRRQVLFTNSYTVICGSDVYGAATVNKAAKTVSLDNYPTQIWQTDLEGYYITFTSDGYNQTFLIQARTDQVLTLFDPTGALVNGSQKWEIKGFRKFERPRIVSMTMYATDHGDTLAPGAAQQGSNTDAP